MTNRHHPSLAHVHPARHHPSLARMSLAGLKFLYGLEAQRGVSEHLNWPGVASGVTLGAGYDMKERSDAAILRDLQAIGLSHSIAEMAAGGSHLIGLAASRFASQHRALVISEQQAVTLLKLIIPHYEGIVVRHIEVELKQHQFDALTSFVYNPGGKFAPVAHAINRGQPEEAMRIMATRVVSDHKISLGLRNRRAKEIALFKAGHY